jgi:hypothetical protein
MWVGRKRGLKIMNRIPRDPYRDWSYDERREASRSDDYEMREAAQRAERDSESSDRAYDEWRSGREFSDPDPDGRFY